MPGAHVRPLMGEYRCELGRSEKVQRADAHDDLRPDAGQAVGGRCRVIHDECAGRLRVPVRQEHE